jgi:hypothetical protein
MKKKLKIIDEICKRHPASGVEKGWSEYTGGMKDTGSWFVRKMLDCSKKELQEFLDKKIEEESKPREETKYSGKVVWCGSNWIQEEEAKFIQNMEEQSERIFFRID